MTDEEIDETIQVYERRATEWATRRRPRRLDRAAAVARQAGARGLAGPIGDLGCGPGWHARALGPRVVAVDASRSMLDVARRHAPLAHKVVGSLDALPLRSRALAGAWASRSYVHLPRWAVPMALADLHSCLQVNAPVELVVLGGDAEYRTFKGDDFVGRRFSLWPRDLFAGVLEGAGFAIDEEEVEESGSAPPHHHWRLTRRRTLPDTVGPEMRLLICGLNPSIHAADAGVGFARPGNRFWPAALAVGLVDHDRDPRRALRDKGVGMTDLVKRATAAASELGPDEYRAGLMRVERLVEWLRPAAVCVVGLTGWRAARDRHAVAGVQREVLGGRPVYLMPSTSGLNAHCLPADFERHLRAAATLADGAPASSV